MIPAIFLLVGVILLAVVISGRMKDQRILKTWNRITGTMLRAGLTESRDSDDRRMSYGLALEYEYSVNGQSFRSSKLRPFDQHYRSNFKGQLEKAIAPLQPGTPVELLHNPAQPGECVLARQLSPASSGVIFIIVGVAFTLFGLIWLVVAR